MAAKTFFVVCAQALLIQCAFSQCLSRGPAQGAALANPYGLAYDGLAYGAGCGLASPSSTGGGFLVTSVSPIAPTGLTIMSENAIEGALIVGGAVPFLGAVSLEGVLPTAGVGAVSYGCGSEAIGIISEGPISTGIVGPGQPYGPGPAYGPAPIYGPGLVAAGPQYGPGLGYNVFAGTGCGCGF